MTKNFPLKKKRLEHELDEHEEEMSSHHKEDRKSDPNKPEQKEQTKSIKETMKFSMRVLE